MDKPACSCNKVILLGSDDEGLKSIRCGDCGREMTRNVKDGEYEYVPKEDLEKAKGAAFRAFVEGAKWWEFEKTGFTMFQGEQDRAALEAAKRKYPFVPTIERVLFDRLRTVIMEGEPMPLIKFLGHLSRMECRCDPEVNVMCEACISRDWVSQLRRFFPEEKDGGG